MDGRSLQHTICSHAVTSGSGGISACRQEVAADTNSDTTDVESRGVGGVFGPMQSTLCHRQTPLKNRMVMLAKRGQQWPWNNAGWAYSQLVPIFVPMAVFSSGTQCGGECWKARKYGLSSLSRTCRNAKNICGVRTCRGARAVAVPGARGASTGLGG